MSTPRISDLLALAADPQTIEKLAALDPDFARGVERARQRLHAKEPLPTACRTCPWRLANDGLKDPQDHRASPVFYTPEARRVMWEGGVLEDEEQTVILAPGAGACDGRTIICHATVDDFVENAVASTDTRAHFCAGATGIQHRAVLRAFARGDGDVSPLTPLGARRVVAAMLNVPESEIDLEAWTAAGEPITRERLIEACHPLAFDAVVGTDDVPAPSPDEIEAWKEGAADRSA